MFPPIKVFYNPVKKELCNVENKKVLIPLK